MPYIKQERRGILRDFYDQPDNSGELNFQLTQVVLEYMEKHGKSYAAVNDILGALEGAKLEFYRRVAAPYEDRKIAENGDVYPA